MVPAAARMRIVRGIRPISSPHTLHAWTITYTVPVDLRDVESPPFDPELRGTGVDVDSVYGTVLPLMWPDHGRALLAAIA